MQKQTDYKGAYQIYSGRKDHDELIDTAFWAHLYVFCASCCTLFTATSDELMTGMDAVPSGFPAMMAHCAAEFDFEAKYGAVQPTARHHSTLLFR